jgi:Spy/CpxP family protein refolding chaperone
MKLSLRKSVVFGSLAGALALVTASVALADAAGGGTRGHSKHHGGHREGLLGAALRLESLTPEQRSSIEALIQERRSASVPVRQAEARVLTELAQQVERANLDANALSPSLSAERSAAAAYGTIDKDLLARLHAVLTPSQRGALVDELVAHRAADTRDARRAPAERREGGEARLALTKDQKDAIRANLSATREPASEVREHHAERRAALESFRGESFDPSALVGVQVRGERAERLAQAMVPVLTPAQRASLAGELRGRAARAGS